MLEYAITIQTEIHCIYIIQFTTSTKFIIRQTPYRLFQMSSRQIYVLRMGQ